MVESDGVCNVTNYHEWERLDERTKDFAMFQAIIGIDRFIQDYHHEKWKRTISQMASAFMGGVVFWAAIFIFCRDLVSSACK